MYSPDTPEITGCAVCRTGGLMMSLTALIPRWALHRPGKHTDRHGHTSHLCPVSLGRKTKCTGRENAAIGSPARQPGAQDHKMHHNTHPVTGAPWRCFEYLAQCVPLDTSTVTYSGWKFGPVYHSNRKRSFPRSVHDPFNLQKKCTDVISKR